ncbi:hypothetical protein HYE67_005585 [Fusarium culmorum]|uniref:Secreted protein n=1 Tax=Fusarium culmorum TaxID=5516 RepID=A0A2T4GFM3_FUSCU|nr:hypothetical protein FCULG_00011885 [Fusarium culmorum]QPC63354.1 hypothetical protein HYE67_005585 [Fusarium culmorum]
MRIHHFLSLLGFAYAAPTEGDYPVTLNKRQTAPTIPPVRPLPTAPLYPPINFTSCPITIKQDPGFQSFKAYNVPANLYIVDVISSPGTKNGANPYEFFLTTGSSIYRGGIVFATNQYVMQLPYQLGPVNNDFVRTRMTEDGYVVANVDYSNLENPTKTPLSFNVERAVATGKYDPPTSYRIVDGWVAVRVKDNAADGVIQLPTVAGGGPLYVARFSGPCMKTVASIPVRS